MSCLSYTWRPVVGLQFAAYTYLFTLSSVRSQEPIALVVFALCAVGTFSIAGLTIGKPVQLWHLGDLLLSYIDGGAIKLISIVWDLLCRFVFEPLFEMIIIPLWLMLLGWLVLLTDGCAWLAGVLWACSIGLFLSKFLPIISVIYSNPITALAFSGGMLWGMFQIYLGNIIVPLFLQPMVVLTFIATWFYAAASWVLFTVFIPAVQVPFNMVLAQLGSVAIWLGISFTWIPNITSILGGQVFSELQFGFRVYAAILLVSLIWRFVCQRDSDAFYALFGDLKVPASQKIETSLSDLKRLNSIAKDDTEKGSISDSKNKMKRKKTIEDQAAQMLADSDSDSDSEDKQKNA